MREARLSGDNVVYGNATHREILELARIHQAKVLVVCLNQKTEMIKVIQLAKQLNKKVKILVRSYGEEDLDSLQKSGATTVVPETLEFSLLLASHLLLLMGVSGYQAQQRISDSRKHRYQLLREIFPGHSVLESSDILNRHKQLHAVAVPKQAYAVNQRLQALQLTEISVQVISLRRGETLHTNPQGRTTIAAGDILVLFATPENLARAERIILQGP